MINVTDLTSKLQQIALKLPKPTDYFSGFGAEGLFLKPENLLLFNRITAGDLLEMEGMPMKIKQHSRWVLIMPLEGEGVVYLDEDSYTLTSGELLLIRPFEVHTISTLAAGKLHWLLLTFDLPFEMHPRISEHRYYQKATNWFWQLCHACVEAYMAEDELVRHSTIYIASLLLIEMMNNDPMKRDHAIAKGRLPETYQLVRNFMKVTRVADWNISNAAQFCHLSPSRLRARFKNNMQMSLGSYLQHCRLMEAAKELKTTKKSIAKISERSGYESEYSFSRVFKSTFGTPPGAYRKSTV